VLLRGGSKTAQSSLLLSIRPLFKEAHHENQSKKA